MPKPRCRDWVNAYGLSKMIGVSSRTLHTWRRYGYGPRAYLIGDIIKYKREDVAAWLETQSMGDERALSFSAHMAKAHPGVVLKPAIQPPPPEQEEE